jgi:hypothetical protein
MTSAAPGQNQTEGTWPNAIQPTRPPSGTLRSPKGCR